MANGKTAGGLECPAISEENSAIFSISQFVSDKIWPRGPRCENELSQWNGEDNHGDVTVNWAIWGGGAVFGKNGTPALFKLHLNNKRNKGVKQHVLILQNTH